MPMTMISKLVFPRASETPTSSEDGSLISLAASDPLAANDSAKLGEDDTVSLTPLSNDTDPLSGALAIGLINGVAVSIGDVITLASGARVTVEADGSLTYDTNGVFAGLNDGETILETFTYQAFVAGAASPRSAVFELSALDGTNGFKVHGVAAGDGSGGSVASAGDVNGDGIDDFIIGAEFADPNGSGSGASYLVFGRSSGFPTDFELSSLDGSNGFKISGERAGESSGGSVASAGDLNGDGYGDIIIGAEYAAPNGYRCGASYVVFGKASGFASNLNLSTLNGANGFQLNGEKAGDYSCRSAVSAGDVNGDGYDDLVIGASGADDKGSSSGVSYVIFGKASGYTAEFNFSTLNGINGFQVNGELAGDHSGRSVAGAGDINGDGYDDLVFGTFGANPNGRSSGATYVVFGKASGFPANFELSALTGANGFQINGEKVDDYSGRNVSAIGDMNGDGYADILIGARLADRTGSESGAAYVVFGKASGFAAVLELSALDGTNGFEIDGEAAGDRLGYAVGAAGDINGDGYDDIIVGAAAADPNGSGSGASYVIFGRASGFGALFDLALLDGTNGFQISGIGIEDHSGAAVSGAGDVNGDGIDDLIVGADGADPHGLESGTSYIIFGSADIASRFSNTATVTITIKGQNERVDGSAAADTLVGSSLGDALFGLAGNDDLSGLGGNDLFFGGKGDDLLHGGDGVDTAVYSEATSAVVVDLATGLAQGGGGADQLDGIENLTGSRFDDTLSGFQGGNLLDGGVGNDLLSGFGGNDILIGGKGADILIGGAGADVMTGGKDADIFRFAVLSHSNATFRDRITDFSSQDSLDLSLLDADAGTAGDQAFHLVGAFTGAAAELVLSYDAAARVTTLLLDVNGDSVADFELTLNGRHEATTGWSL